MGQIKITTRLHYNVTVKMERKVFTGRWNRAKKWTAKFVQEGFGDTPMGVLLDAIESAELGHSGNKVKAITNVQQIPEYPAIIILDIQP